MRRSAIVLVAGLIAGAVLGAAGAALALRGDGEPPALSGSAPRGALERLPPGPVTVVAETIRLGAGFTSRHRHGGPTINLVRAGTVEIDDEAGRRRYRPGEVFVEPPGRAHVIRIAADATIDVVRLLPPRAAATTEVPPAP